MDRCWQPLPDPRRQARIETEIVGGYLLLNAADLDEAVAIMRSCPIFDAGGYAEIRETGS